MINDDSNKSSKSSEAFNKPKGNEPASGAKPASPDAPMTQRIVPSGYHGGAHGRYQPPTASHDPRANTGGPYSPDPRDTPDPRWARNSDPRYAPDPRYTVADAPISHPGDGKIPPKPIGDITVEVASIWVSGDDGTEILEAIKGLAREYQFLLVEDGPPVKGSWWQRLKLSFWQAYGSGTVRGVAEDLRLRAEMEIAARDRAEIDEQNASTIATLVAAIDKQQEAVVVFGPTVIVKHNGSIFVREIDPRTASKLRQMPTLATSPEAMLEALNRATAETAVDSGPDRQRASQTQFIAGDQG